ncbi:MAG: hypothetical protein KIS61_36605, partial [Candidatus Eremiobacteraeota bacterium]|nr:hypothetical protein [Candidatus Eremiobacteraeota bacterium]
DDLGVSEDVRDDAGWSSGDRINSLNQIMRQDVGGDTWTFSYDDNGNMTGKTNGVDTWTYSWDTVDGRLTRVQGPGGVDVSYVYDASGRMTSRDDGVDVTTFLWHGFDCVREQTGMSTTTYCIPDGRLTSFIRDGDRFDCHTDALGSVRLVTDDNGDVVLRRDFDAWGGELAGNFDSVPGGMRYGFVGSLGLRTDPSTSLIYVRQRWYDSDLRIFVSRDPIGIAGNRYAYCNGSPTNCVDISGLEPRITGSAGTTPNILGAVNDLSVGLVSGGMRNDPNLNYPSPLGDVSPSAMANLLNNRRGNDIEMVVDYQPGLGTEESGAATRGDIDANGQIRITTMIAKGGGTKTKLQIRNMLLHELIHGLQLEKFLREGLAKANSLPAECDCIKLMKEWMDENGWTKDHPEDIFNKMDKKFPSPFKTNYDERFDQDSYAELFCNRRKKK